MAVGRRPRFWLGDVDFGSGLGSGQAAQQALALAPEGLLQRFGLAGFIDMANLAAGQIGSHALPVKPVEDAPVGKVPLLVVGVGLVVDIKQLLVAEYKVGGEKIGSSRLSGEGRLDFQKKVF